ARAPLRLRSGQALARERRRLLPKCSPITRSLNHCHSEPKLYRLRSAFIAFIYRSTGRRLILISVLGIGWYTLPLIYAFHRFSVHVRSQIFEFAALTRKIVSAWYLRLPKSSHT